MAQQAQNPSAPTRLPLVTDPENRADLPDKDARLVNCYAERAKGQEYWIRKRFGTLKDATNSQSAAAGSGLYNWKGNIYSVFAATLYKNGSSLGTVDSTGGVYAWSQTLGATNYLVLGNGAKAYTYDGTTLAQITDGDFPSAFVKGWAYLDSTTYVTKPGGPTQGSDLNDPTAWDALNTITAQIEPDAPVATAKQLVYVIILKQWTTEIFYDAANATGSPLGTVQGAKVSYGCASADSVQTIDDALFWLSTTRSAMTQVIMLAGLKAEVISTPQVERLLDDVDFTQAIYSWQLKDQGHSFYVVTSKSANLTLAYDIKERLWVQWVDVNGNYLPIVASTYTSTMGHLLQHETNGNVYLADEAYYNDDGSVITVDIYSPQFDGGVDRRKYLSLMRVVADQQAGSVLRLRKNDHDYDATRWSGWRSFDLSQKRPIITECGTFDKRAFNFRHQSNTPLRIKAVDLQIELGVLGGP